MSTDAEIQTAINNYETNKLNRKYLIRALTLKEFYVNDKYNLFIYYGIMPFILKCFFKYNNHI